MRNSRGGTPHYSKSYFSNITNQMKFLNKEYKKYDLVHKSWKNGFFSSIVVFLIFFLFQPFGFSDKDPDLKLFLFPAYTLLTFFYSISTFFFVRHILKTKKVWTIKNELLSFAISMLPLTILVHLITYWFAGDMPLNLYWYFKLLYNVSSLFIVISVIEFLYYSNKSADVRIEHLSSQIQLFSQQIDSGKGENNNEIVSISLEKDSVEIKKDKIVIIQSIGNYLEFTLRETDGQIKKLMKRGRMHQAEKDLENFLEFFRCHRAFIVNLKKAKRMKGNIKNARLVFDDILEEIPVSRLHFKTLKEQLDKIIAT